MAFFKSQRRDALVLFLFSFFLYANTIGHDFAWDDKIVIQENERVQQGISGIPNLFLKYSSDLRQDKYGYRPITLTAFAIEYSMFGENPAGFHLMNVLYFSLLCMVVYLVLRSLFASLNLMLPFLITLFFAAHPIHTEVVANIKSRDEIFAMLFGMLALYHFNKAYVESRLKPLIWGTLFFLLAFLSRENAITFLAVIPLALLLQGPIRRKMFLKVSLLLPVLGAIAFGFVFYAATSTLGQEQTAGMGVYEENNILGNAFFYEDSYVTRVGNAFHLTTAYLGKFLLPYPLTYYSGYNTIQMWGPLGKILGALLILIGCVFLPIRYFRKNPLFAFGALFFLVTISVYLHLLQTLSDTMADRFLFLPSLGLCMMLVAGIDWLMKKFANGKQITSWKEIPMVVRSGGLVILVLLVGMTFVRNRAWADDFTLISTDMPHLEDCARAHYYYATELNLSMQNGGWDSETEASMIAHYRRSMEISDSIYYGRLELATYFLNDKDFEQGIPILEEMIDLFPQVSDPYYFLGQSFVQRELFDKAVPVLEKCLALAPNSHDATYLLAISYGKTGAYDKGIALAKQGMKDYPKATGNMYEALGYIYFDKGNMTASNQATFKLLEYGHEPYKVYATVIGRYQTLGDSVNALRYYQEAIAKGAMQAAVPPQ